MEHIVLTIHCFHTVHCLSLIRSLIIIIVQPESDTSEPFAHTWDKYYIRARKSATSRTMCSQIKLVYAFRCFSIVILAMASTWSSQDES